MVLTLLLASTFLNGVNIDGLRSQSFEKCKSVKVDDRGDVYMDCPGYEVKEAPAPSALVPPPAIAASGLLAPPAAITKHYWLVSEEKAGAQYDLDVFVNAKWMRKIKAGEPQIVLEVTKYLRPGPNKILFAATKRLEGARSSVSPASFLKVTIGEGEAGGNTVMIDNPLVECKRTAAETDNVNEEFNLQAR
jgi:hypothetical protein